ncbi:MAG: ArsR/SmtB family transcription factor [Betaproteobacteria bacterium]
MSNSQEPRLARAAAMIADPARSRMLSYLLAGQYASAGELARAGSVTAPTASAHLGKLLASGFVICEARGRHRYYRLADAEIAHALEALALVAERAPAERAWASPERRRLRYARCCYRHLAGALGVALFTHLLQEQHLRSSADGYALTPSGEAWIHRLGCTPPTPGPGRRFAYACLDWSERRDHLAGSLADALLDHFVSRHWLRRNVVPRTVMPGAGSSHRALTLTPTGQRELLPQLGLDAAW